MDLAERWRGHALQEGLLEISSTPDSTSPLLCDLKILICIQASLVYQAGKHCEAALLESRGSSECQEGGTHFRIPPAHTAHSTESWVGGCIGGKTFPWIVKNTNPSTGGTTSKQNSACWTQNLSLRQHLAPPAGSGVAP